MAAKKASKLGTKPGNVKTQVRTRVLHEAGYKCANPRCRYPITLDVHHLHYVSEGGTDDPANLLPLCPTCHAEHHAGKIPSDSLRSWKMLLLALNEAFDRRSVDMLLTIYKLGGGLKHLDGQGILTLAPLVASDLVGVRIHWEHRGKGGMIEMYVATITGKGKMFVEGWLSGDQNKAIPQLSPSELESIQP